MNLTELTNHFHRAAVKAGWWAGGSENLLLVATKFALIHSEVSEAFEGYRKNIPDIHIPHRSSVEVELADVLIRIFDLAGALNLDLESAIFEKAAYNETRSDHKLAERAKPHGKKF